MTRKPPRLRVMNPGTSWTNIDGLRQFWRDFSGIGPVVFVEEGWPVNSHYMLEEEDRGQSTYFVTNRDDVLGILRDPATYPRLDRAGFNTEYRLPCLHSLSRPEVKRDMRIKLRGRTPHLLRRNPKTISLDFAGEVFRVLLGAPFTDDRRFIEHLQARQSPFLRHLPQEIDARDVFEKLTVTGFVTLRQSAELLLCQLENPSNRNELRAHADHIPGFVNRILTLSPTVVVLARTNTESVTVSGYDIPAGSHIELCSSALSIEGFHAGNHQEDMTFGLGPHRCVAAHLAKQALAIFTLEALKLWP